jgi:hypothetical protein
MMPVAKTISDYLTKPHVTSRKSARQATADALKNRR